MKSLISPWIKSCSIDISNIQSGEKMRRELKKIEGKRTRFRATVERFGSKKNYHGFPEPTILYKDVVFADSLEIACDHLFTVGKTIAALMLKPGDVVEFDARVGIIHKRLCELSGVHRREGN